MHVCDAHCSSATLGAFLARQCPAVVCTMSSGKSRQHVDLGDGSDVLYFPNFFDIAEADRWLKVLDKEMPWNRPSLFIYGRPCLQPRESCYVANQNLPVLKYSGQEPVVRHWEDYPVLRCILDAVNQALPDSHFNSVLLNRYANGSDYVGWHSDNEKLYGPAPAIASVSLGTEREFLLRMKKSYKLQMSKRGTHDSRTTTPTTDSSLGDGRSSPAFTGKQNRPTLKKPMAESDSSGTPPALKARRLNSGKPATTSLTTDIRNSSDGKDLAPREQYSFSLRHGSLLVMRGNMQRDWDHSVPKRVKAAGLRISLTFRKVCQ